MILIALFGLACLFVWLTAWIMIFERVAGTDDRDVIERLADEQGFEARDVNPGRHPVRQ
jgi:hypothetical protein